MILLTGATGYIGSHTWLELLLAGNRVIGLDNFINSSPLALARIEALAPKLLEVLKNQNLLNQLVQPDVQEAVLIEDQSALKERK